jgi:hypothetical protein
MPILHGFKRIELFLLQVVNKINSIIFFTDLTKILINFAKHQ